MMQLMTMREGGRRGGKTRKQGNVILDLRKLMGLVAGGTLTIAGATALPMLAPFAILAIWQQLTESLEIEVSEMDASVLWSMHLHSDDDGRIDGGEPLLALANAERAQYQRRPISRSELDDCLRNLAKLRCIERDGNAQTRWRLIERLSLQY